MDRRHTRNRDRQRIPKRLRFRAQYLLHRRVIDVAEGVMPQTKFVLAKALKQGLKPIVVINKLDTADQRADEVLLEQHNAAFASKAKL